MFPATETSRIMVMTFNTANDFVAAQALIALLDRSCADIVGLQELSARNAAALENALGDAYPSRILFGDRITGKGLLSRYPLLWHERFKLASRRVSLEAQLRVRDQTVRVFVVHPPPPNVRRLEVSSPLATRDIILLLERVAGPTPALLLGDFNFTARSAKYRLMRAAGLIDTFGVAGRGRGLTCPTRYQYAPIPLCPLVRIDYVWATSHFRPLRSSVGKSCGSDHRPVFAELALTDGPGDLAIPPGTAAPMNAPSTEAFNASPSTPRHRS
jgi:endonuclease/exonuclease/phosphatase (EEP) superfamily protein YafD